MKLQQLSLSRQIIAIIAVGFGAFLVFVVLGVYGNLRNSALLMIQDQIFVLASAISDDLDAKLRVAKQSLEKEAENMPERLFGNPEEAQTFTTVVFFLSATRERLLQKALSSPVCAGEIFLTVNSSRRFPRHRKRIFPVPTILFTHREDRP
jgi:hypothetical protein